MGKLKSVLKSPHFWIIGFITLLFIFIYYFWPWRERQFFSGFPQYLMWLSPLYNLALFEMQYHMVGSLFLIPIIYAVVIFKWSGTLIVFAVAMAGISRILAVLWTNVDSLITNISLLLLPIVVGLTISIELELRRKDKQILIDQEKDRRLYMAKILETQEKERQRLAEELHDESIQTLLAVASYAEYLESDRVDNILEMKQKATLIKETTRSTVDEIRRIIIDLRPKILDNIGLIPALKWLIERKSKEGNISIQFVAGKITADISPSVELTVFRIVQEAIQNVIRHARAKSVIINLNVENEQIRLTIQDDGRGFTPPSKFTDLVMGGKLGLLGIYERTISLDGTFEIFSKPGSGTSLSIKIPVNISESSG